jgi:glyoxylase I family protein
MLPGISGFHHVAITVSDLERSVRWYDEVLGLKVLFPYDTEDFERRIIGQPGGVVIGVTQHRRTDGDFNERQVGLDHLAFAVESQADLEAWAARFDELGVTHSGVSVTPVTGSALIAFRDPDNIQLEMYVQAGRPQAMS